MKLDGMDGAEVEQLESDEDVAICEAERTRTPLNSVHHCQGPRSEKVFDLVMRNCLCLHSLNFVNSAACCKPRCGIQKEACDGLEPTEAARGRKGWTGTTKLSCVTMVNGVRRLKENNNHHGVGYLVDGHYRR